MPSAPANAPSSTAKPAVPPLPFWQRVASRTALVAGMFCVVVAVALAVNWFQYQSRNPLTSQRLVDMKAQLVREPVNEPLKKDIRALDLQLRLAHDRYLLRLHRGQWLLFGGAALFLASLQTSLWRRKIARPDKRLKSPGWQAREIRQSTIAVGALGAILGIGAWMLAANSSTELSARLVQPPAATNAPPPVKTAAIPPLPSPEEYHRQWPRFRGPDGSGISAFTNAPLSWNLETGENVLWKTPVPFAPNSPVVWKDRVFLTAGDANKREVLCFDAASGKLLWRKPVEVSVRTGGPLAEVGEMSGYAPSTAATEGRLVFAIFVNGDVGAFDFEGNAVWARNLGIPENQYGHATSLATAGDKLLVQLDQGSDASEGKSRLLALNGPTGELVWQSEPRPVPNSWATPIVIQAAGREQIITCGNPWLIAYAPADGKELWRGQWLGGEVTPSPVFGADQVFAVSDEKLLAIRPDGSGDVTKTHVAWHGEDGLPDISSPLCDGRRVYLLTSYGRLTCYGAADGKKLWEKELELGFKASPALAGDRLYLCDEKGTVVVVQAGDEFKELARSALGEEVMASPAFAGGKMFIRGTGHVFCFGGK